MKSELDFLKTLKSELSDVEYGEGVLFNLRDIEEMVKNRIKELDEQHQPTVKEDCEHKRIRENISGGRFDECLDCGKIY